MALKCAPKRCLTPFLGRVCGTGNAIQNAGHGACAFGECLCDAGFEAYNGGGPAHIAAARVYEMTESGELPPYTPPMP